MFVWGRLGDKWLPLGSCKGIRRVYLVSNWSDQTKKYGTIINYVRAGCARLTAEIVLETPQA